MTLSTVIPGVFTMPRFFSPEECQEHIARTEKIGYEAATISTLGRTVRDESVRNNHRVIHDDFELARELWSRVADFVPKFVDGHQAIGLNERFRFYRYHPGETFKGHVDGVCRRENGEHSRFTFMVYLNSDFEGGETKFLETAIKPEQGMALIFRHELFHEGAPVSAGVKYVLRSDVMFNPLGVLRG